MPSLGFCMLLSEPLTALAGASQRRRAVRGASAVLIAALLAAYGARTWVRNADWATEETLFIAAMRVCPDSAKVRLNNGIIARRYENWTGAIAHFSRAQEIEPGYCETTYWIGITMVRCLCAEARLHCCLQTGIFQVNQNKIDEGMQLLVDALDCKWVAVEAAKVLQQIITARLTAQPADVKALLAEGALLTRVTQLEQACDSFIKAAAALEQQGKTKQAKAARARCDTSGASAQLVCAACAQLTQLHRMPVTGPNSCNALVEAHRGRVAEATAAAERGSADDDEHLEELRITRSELARAFIAKAGSRCRASSQAYLEALNTLQRADAYDPFLHREWGLALRARGRDAEAEQHITVAATLFEQALGMLNAGHDIAGPQMLPAGDGLSIAALRRELGATRALLAPAKPAKAAKTRGGEL